MARFSRRGGRKSNSSKNPDSSRLHSESTNQSPSFLESAVADAQADLAQANAEYEGV
jgi:hypothetical protein